MPIARVSTENVVELLDDGRRRYNVGAAQRRQQEEHAFIAVEIAGTTSSLRAFTTRPAGAMVGPRRVIFSRGPETYTRSYAMNSLYLPLCYPLAWPRGKIMSTQEISAYSDTYILRFDDDDSDDDSPGAADLRRRRRQKTLTRRRKTLTIGQVTLAHAMQPAVRGWLPESDTVATMLG